MGMKTKVLNTTDKDIILKEGTAGIYRLLINLKPEKSYTINLDPNATYREYWCAVKDDDPKAVILSSDDCQEYAIVRIRENIEVGNSQAPLYFWEGVLRDSKRVAKDALEKALPCSNSEETSNKSFLEKIMLTLGFFKRGYIACDEYPSLREISSTDHISVSWSWLRCAHMGVFGYLVCPNL